ncbi:Phytosulfokine-beta like [Actinidia chinensis var. chinensis]|uniref:Phytosulfokine n=1 Tax=Actinidia chinensis var. chinensis TaxID=1590841 RepID=A0A2R6RL16_ACTCC|nr:Phytosulfokine-beta like [Actinidia chinensis var. chinensis]
MSKITILFLLSLLLCSTLSYAARPQPLPVEDSPVKTHLPGGEDTHHGDMFDESCDGVGDEECLMRRTLAAHVDYIYTQKNKP